MKLFSVTFYKLKMMISDKPLFAAMIVIPLILTVLTGFALRYEKLNIIPMAFVDEDKSDYSKLLLERLQKKEGILIKTVARDEALDMLKNNKVEAAFIVKEGFMKNIEDGTSKEIIDLIKSPASFSIDFIKELVSGEVIRFTANHMSSDWVLKKYKNMNKPVSQNLAQEVVRHSDSMWGNEVVMPVNYQELEGNVKKDVKRNSPPSAAATSRGIIIFFIMFYVLFSSGWLVEERQNGTLKRLASGPNTVGLSFLGNIISLFILSALQFALFYLIYRLMFGVELFTGACSYLVLGAYVLAVISIGMFLSSVLKTPAQLQTGAPVFALLTGFAGGCFWNLIEVPEKVRNISLLTPQGWTLEAVNKLSATPEVNSVILIPSIILLSFALILLPLSYIIIRVQVGNQ